MAKGVLNSEAFNKQLVETVLQNRRARGVKTVDDEFTGGTKRLIASRFPRRCVILDEDLDAAEDSMRSPTSCLATVLIWSVTDEKYTESEQQITVWNHSETTEYAVDTFGAAEHIDGHYWFFGDCAAMAERDPEEEEA